MVTIYCNVFKNKLFLHLWLIPHVDFFWIDIHIIYLEYRESTYISIKILNIAYILMVSQCNDNIWHVVP